MPREPDEQIVARMFWDSLDADVPAAAQMLGPAPGVVEVTGKKELDYWNEVDPKADGPAVYAQARMQGDDYETALTKATFMQYPNRGKMLEAVAPTSDPEHPTKRVAYAKRMARESEQAGIRPQPSAAPPDLSNMSNMSNLSNPTNPTNPTDLAGLAQQYAQGATA